MRNHVLTTDVPLSVTRNPIPPKTVPADAAGADAIVRREPGEGYIAVTCDLLAEARACENGAGAATYLDWCRTEAARINKIEGRRAVVYVRAGFCTVYATPHRGA